MNHMIQKQGAYMVRDAIQWEKGIPAFAEISRCDQCLESSLHEVAQHILTRYFIVNGLSV